MFGGCRICNDRGGKLKNSWSFGSPKISKRENSFVLNCLQSQGIRRYFVTVKSTDALYAASAKMFDRSLAAIAVQRLSDWSRNLLAPAAWGYSDFDDASCQHQISQRMKTQSNYIFPSTSDEVDWKCQEEGSKWIKTRSIVWCLRAKQQSRGW